MKNALANIYHLFLNVLQTESTKLASRKLNELVISHSLSFLLQIPRKTAKNFSRVHD